MITSDQARAYILRLMADGKTRSATEIIEQVSDMAELSVEERMQRLPTGQPRAANRIGWGYSAFIKAGILERPARGQYVITKLGRQKAQEWQNRDIIRENDLIGLPAWDAYRGNVNAIAQQQPNQAEIVVNLEESEVAALQAVTAITENTTQELLERLRNVSPESFEKIVIQMLRAMDYSDRKKFLKHLECSHDGSTNNSVCQDSLDIRDLHEVKMEIQRANYASLNARQKEHYNFAKVAGFLCEYGFHAMRLSDDWNGADFLALHKDKEITLKVQLKSACAIYKKYQNKDIYLAFPAITNGESERKWYLLSHDLLMEIVGKNTNALNTPFWKKNGWFNFPSISQKLSAALQNYRIDNNADYLTPNTWNE